MFALNPKRSKFAQIPRTFPTQPMCPPSQKAHQSRSLQPSPSRSGPTHLAQEEVVQRHLALRVDVLQVPAEALALEAVAQRASLTHIARGRLARSFASERTRNGGSVLIVTSNTEFRTFHRKSEDLLPSTPISNHMQYIQLCTLQCGSIVRLVMRARERKIETETENKTNTRTHAQHKRKARLPIVCRTNKPKKRRQ